MLLLALLQACKVLHLPGMRVSQRLQRLAVLVCRITHELLDVGDPLLDGGVVRREGADVLGMLRQVRAVLRLTRLQRRQLALVLVRRLAQLPLHKVQALLDRRVLHLGAAQLLQVLSVPALHRGVLGVGFLQRLNLPRVLVGRVANQLLDVVHPIGQRGRSHHGAQLLGVPIVRRPQALQLAPVLVSAVAQLPVQLVQALLQHPVQPLPLPHGVEVPRVLVVRRAKDLELARVLLRGVTECLLCKANTLVQRRRVLRMPHLQLLNLLGLLGVGRVMLGVRCLQIPLMLLARVVEQALEVVYTLLQRGVAARDGLVDLAVPCQVGRVPQVRCFQRLQLRGMLVSRVTQGLLKVCEAILEVRVLRACGPDAGQVLGVPAVGVLEGLQLLSVLLSRLAQEPLQVVHALLESGVLRAHAPHAGELPRVLLVGRLQHLVLVGAVLQHSLHILHTLRQRRMVFMGRLHAIEVSRVPLVRRLQGLQLALVAVRALTQGTLHGVEALLRGRPLGVGGLAGLQLPGMPVLPHAQRLKLLTMLVYGIAHLLLQVAYALGQAGVVRECGDVLHAP
mmetsp:Transcript_23246/g.66061  ORF Transcript_23246/g.66061 Transcript_23246/m.66061 type:complete len:564 (-) Transcript_23246:721-2412(-)